MVEPSAFRLPLRAWQVGDASLGDAVAGPPSLDEQLRAEGVAGALDPDLVHQPTGDQLEGAVDVAGGVAEQRVDQYVPAPAVEAAHPGIRSRVPVADDQVGRLQERQQRSQLAGV